MLKKIINKLLFNHVTKNVLDIMLSPFTLLSCLLLKYFRKDWSYLPISEKIYNITGIFPIQDHYYEPLYNARRYLQHSLSKDRNLPGINFNIEEQLSLLSQLNFTCELENVALDKPENLSFYFRNGFFSFGDAEYYYNLIRLYKPSRIYEIGSGNSTLIAEMAVKRNRSENEGYVNEIICIEPYEMPWLEKLNVIVKRVVVEKMELSFFMELERNDILFIDSSHMIRPQGDVLFEILEILPKLSSGVLIHIHDIFTPKDYIDDWIKKDHRFWNEQYLLEAFLSCNNDFRILGSLNYLRHHYEEIFEKKMTVNRNLDRIEPGSFWLVKN